MGTITASYPLAVDAGSQQVQLNEFMPGYYTVALVRGGVVLDSKTLIVK